MSDVQGSSVRIMDAPASARFNLRCDPAQLEPASAAFGVALSTRIGAMASKDGRRTLCVGPDEWLLWADEADRDGIVAAFDALYAETPHSLVEVSDRELAFVVEGPGAALALAAGCPLDLSEMSPGSGTRTIFDTVPVTLIREAANRFKLEVWRSFAPLVRGLLELACEELAFKAES